MLNIGFLCCVTMCHVFLFRFCTGKGLGVRRHLADSDEKYAEFVVSYIDDPGETAASARAIAGISRLLNSTSVNCSLFCVLCFVFHVCPCFDVFHTLDDWTNYTVKLSASGFGLGFFSAFVDVDFNSCTPWAVDCVVKKCTAFSVDYCVRCTSLRQCNNLLSRVGCKKM